MGPDFWYVDPERNRLGPVTREEILRLIGAGTIRRETLVWATGMTDWRIAGEIEGFSALFGPVEPPALPPGGQASTPWGANAPAASAPPPFDRQVAAAAPPPGALGSALPVWGLFGRLLLVAIGSLLVVPSPWTSTAFYRFVCAHTALPGGRRLGFAGKPEDVWYLFMAVSALSLATMAPLEYGGLVVLLVTWGLQFLILKWFVANVGSEDGRVKLAFAGEVLPYIGWNFLLIVSFVTIIGWAWVLKFMMQWICRNVRGTTGFEFTATGFDILWRSIVFALLCTFVIPIPWLTRWYASWMISQVSAVPAGIASTLSAQPQPVR